MGVSQQTVSRYESSDTLEDDVLDKIAKAQNVSVQAIKEFSEEATFNIVANTFNDTFNENSAFISYYPTFNPIGKIVQLYDEKVALYERMLQAEKEKVGLLEEVLKNKK